MNRKFVILLVVFATSCATVLAQEVEEDEVAHEEEEEEEVHEEEVQECSVPEPGGAIDWDRMPDALFLTMSVHEKFLEAALCYVAVGIHKTDDGFAGHTEDYHIVNGSVVRGNLQFAHELQDSGGYLLKNPEATFEEWKHELADTQEKEEEFDKEIEVVRGHEEFFYTDYENYMLGLICVQNGRKMIAVEHVTPNPTEKQIEMIHDKLEDIGNGWDDVELYMTKCSEMEDYLEEGQFTDRFGDSDE